jgi:hypothetical protein
LCHKAENGSQKQNVFYHRLFLNTVKNAKFRKKIATLAKLKNEPAGRRPPGHLRQGDRWVPRNEDALAVGLCDPAKEAQFCESIFEGFVNQKPAAQIYQDL